MRLRCLPDGNALRENRANLALLVLEGQPANGALFPTVPVGKVFE